MMEKFECKSCGLSFTSGSNHDASMEDGYGGETLLVCRSCGIQYKLRDGGLNWTKLPLGRTVDGPPLFRARSPDDKEMSPVSDVSIDDTGSKSADEFLRDFRCDHCGTVGKIGYISAEDRCPRCKRLSLDLREMWRT